MNDFTFHSPTKIVFGRKVVDRVGAELAGAGYRRALIVYGQGSVVRTGTLDRVKASLDAVGVEHVELGGVRPNPEITSVREGVELARAHDVDLVLPVGGGSTMDCAKAIALTTPYDGDPWDFWAKRAVPQTALPTAAVVTIPASGSEASNSCVISNDAEGLKCGCTTELNRPVVAFLDPELTFTLPPYQTAAGITDMIAHIMERFFSGEPAVPSTDNIACGLIRAAVADARTVMEHPDDYDARADLMWVGTLAHNGLAGCGLGVPGKRDGDWSCHALEHELSAVDPRVTHGAGLAVLFPAWMRYVWRDHPERIVEFGRQVFGIEAESDGEKAIETAVLATIDALQTFFTSLGMPRTLGELNIRAEHIDQLLHGLSINKGERIGTFRVLTLEDARTIYESAL